jgi:hypothetical protein
LSKGSILTISLNIIGGATVDELLSSVKGILKTVSVSFNEMI